jgi:transcriptional regulator with XRE-family HTH domain
MTSSGKGKPANVDIEVGLRIRARRLLLNKTQTELAKTIGVTFQQVQKYENGANRVAPSRLAILAKVLDVDVAYFFGELNTAGGDRIETELLAVHGAAAMLRAYVGISDTGVRHRLLALAEGLAGISS